MPNIQTTAELLSEIHALRNALLDANSLCRSAFQVANRLATELGTHALQTSFGAMADRFHEALQRQHKVILDTGGYVLAEAQPTPSVPAGWLRAVDEALVVTHLGVANADDSYEDAKRKLNELIGWHTDVATDPAVNGGFKLVPIEPTQEMLDAGEDTFFSTYTGTPTSTPIDVYNAMLAAAPEAKP